MSNNDIDNTMADGIVPTHRCCGTHLDIVSGREPTESGSVEIEMFVCPWCEVEVPPESEP